LSGVVDRSFQKFNPKSLTRSFRREATGAFVNSSRRLCAKNNKAGACGAGLVISNQPLDQLRTVMQEMSARFSVLQTASA
jgi:hypothetical protein